MVLESSANWVSNVTIRGGWPTFMSVASTSEITFWRSPGLTCAHMMLNRERLKAPRSQVKVVRSTELGLCALETNGA